ncbi:hypothetical protein [Fuerstiella marisgermanici]|uniref:Uncharacterized protein n=1 Tax=Fuerstiella marisgermanici TaxID=1891926 RepID=A0A1P8WEG0_9PLAN|nr:hypothetical protein [Fuerstiella marisgermanici]APZ92455.1 hypothetical protein Fuma_02066 [Fuerstiella marisgermanici]
MRRAILNLMKDYPFQLLAIAFSPGMIALAFLLLLLEGLFEPPVLEVAATTFFSLGMVLLLPSGTLCLVLSWRMSRGKNEESDSRDLVEFSLGFFGLIMFSFGVIFSPFTYWFADLLS